MLSIFSEHVYCTETRPYNQGARLTAYELVHDKIPATLICDDMVAALLKTKQITAVVVGADRIAANGDTCNKIGTYQANVLIFIDRDVDINVTDYNLKIIYSSCVNI